MHTSTRTFIMFLVSCAIIIPGGWAKEISRPSSNPTDPHELSSNQNTPENNSEDQLSQDKMNEEPMLNENQSQILSLDSISAPAEKTETEAEAGEIGNVENGDNDKLLQGETRPLGLGGAGGGPGIQSFTNTLTNLPGFQGLSSLFTQLSANGPIGISGSTVLGPGSSQGSTSSSG